MGCRARGAASALARRLGRGCARRPSRSRRVMGCAGSPARRLRLPRRRAGRGGLRLLRRPGSFVGRFVLRGTCRPLLRQGEAMSIITPGRVGVPCACASWSAADGRFVLCGWNEAARPKRASITLSRLARSPICHGRPTTCTFCICCAAQGHAEKGTGGKARD